MILIWKTREKEEDFLENIGDDENKSSVCSMKNPSDEGSDTILPEDDGLDNDSLSDLLEEQESDGVGDLDEWCCEIVPLAFFYLKPVCITCLFYDRHLIYHLRA